MDGKCDLPSRRCQLEARRLYVRHFHFCLIFDFRLTQREKNNASTLILRAYMRCHFAQFLHPDAIDSSPHARPGSLPQALVSGQG